MSPAYATTANAGCATNPARRGAQEHFRETEDDQDRRDVEQQHVLEHVHQHQLLAEPVDGRDERYEDCDQPAAEHEQAAEARRMGLARRAATTPPPHVDQRENRDPQQHARIERPRVVRSHD
jgi:hypothetical protein